MKDVNVMSIDDEPMLHMKKIDPTADVKVFFVDAPSLPGNPKAQSSCVTCRYVVPTFLSIEGS